MGWGTVYFVYKFAWTRTYFEREALGSQSGDSNRVAANRRKTPTDTNAKS